MAMMGPLIGRTRSGKIVPLGRVRNGNGNGRVGLPGRRTFRDLRRRDTQTGLMGSPKPGQFATNTGRRSLTPNYGGDTGRAYAQALTVPRDFRFAPRYPVWF